MIFRILLLLAVVTGLAAPRAAAGAPSASDIYLEPDTPAAIQVTPATDRWNGAGFMPVRVRIENRAERQLGWTLRFVAQMGYSGTTLSHEIFLGVEGGTAAETVVFVPGAGEVPGGQRAMLNVVADGPGARSSNAYLLGGGGGDPVVNTATTPGLESDLFAATNGASGVKTEITALDAARWPADWRVWSPFQYVVFSASDYAALDGARRAALRDWVALGGTLDVFPSGGYNSQARGVERLGHGQIRQREDALSTLRNYSYRPTSERPGSVAALTIPQERRDALRPVIGALGLSLFLVAFGVLVGPLNLFVFAPANRRHRLFVTVPLISLAASLLMAGYIVVKDGFGGEGSQRGLIVLLPDSNQAVLRQQQLARTGVLMGSGFELPDDVILSRVNAEESGFVHRHRSSGDGREFYRRGQGRASGGWFASRRLQEHSLARIVPTRARIELVSGGDGGAAPVVQSSVGTALRDFYYRDGRGLLWSAPELSPGRRVTLTRAASAEAGVGLVNGDFYAKGGAAEGLAPIATLGSIRWDEAAFLYTGPLVGARKP